MRSKDARKARKITRRDIIKHGRLRRSGDQTLKLPKQYRDHYLTFPNGIAFEYVMRKYEETQRKLAEILKNNGYGTVRLAP